MAQGNAHAPISLPRDVIFDVLSWLPVKSLCRFLCVSTEWRALICDPAFAAVHKSQAKPLFLAFSFRFQESSLQLIDMDGNVVRTIADELGHLSKYSVCTRVDDQACVLIGSFTAKVIDLATGEVLVAFHGPRGTLGFGRAVPSGAYKVVSLGNTCEVFTLGDRVGWRKKPELSTYQYYGCYDSGIVVNGMWYLFVQQHGYTQEDTVLCFDLESEEWRKEIQGPPKDNHFWYIITLGELHGSLCVAKSKSDSRDRDGWIVWLLADFDKSVWVKAYVIPLDASTHSQLTPLMVLPDGEKLLFSCSRPRGRGSAPAPLLRIYDPRRGTSTDALKMPPFCAWNISLCNLNLERFISVKI